MAKEKTDRTNRLILIVINNCKKILGVFYSLFFNIYILQYINNNISYVLTYNLAGSIFGLFLSFIIFYILNKKNIKIMYRLSFVFNFAVILLTIFVSPDKLYLPYIIIGLKTLVNSLYYVPYEIAITSKNSVNSTRNFLVTVAVINGITATIAPFFTGLLVKQVSYFVLFAILAVIVIIMFVCSLFIDNLITENNKFAPIKYIKKAKEFKHVRYMYVSHFLKRISESGVIGILIPIFMFSKLGSELSLGTIASITSLAGLAVLIAYVKLKKIRYYVVYISTIITMLSTFGLILFTGATAYILYYIILKTTEGIYFNEHDTTLFNMIQTETLNIYKKEHRFMFGLISDIGDCLTISVTLLILKFLSFNTATVIILCTGIIIRFIALILLQKSDKHFNLIDKLSSNLNTDNV